MNHLLRIYQELEKLALDLGIDVACVPMDTEMGGGLCRVRGVERVLMAEGTSLPQRVEILASALRGRDLDGIYLKPAVRDLLDAS
jgi:hypothetical protein